MPVLHLAESATREDIVRSLLSARKDRSIEDPRVIDLRDHGVAERVGAYAAWWKRVFDLFLILICLPVWGLLYLFIAVVLLITQGRPIHYRSTRVGKGGRDLVVLKFRTMKLDADSRLAALLAADPELAQEYTETVKLRFDPRVTPVGKILRWSSLDELPQLLNVIKGDMSLVGPRPVLRAEMDEIYGPAAGRIMRFRPGLTGLWQISGRSLLPYSERVALDLRYAKTCSLWTDVSILLKTIPCVLRGKGAF